MAFFCVCQHDVVAQITETASGQAGTPASIKSTLSLVAGFSRGTPNTWALPEGCPALTQGKAVHSFYAAINESLKSGEMQAIVARSDNAGLILAPSGTAVLHRDLIITLAGQYKLPAVYYDRSFAAAGGLISYGPDFVDLYRRAAGYVDRILKGEKPADLPVQAPTKYELVINLKTAKALGLTIPDQLLAAADEVIE